MSGLLARVRLGVVAACVAISCSAPLPSLAADDVLARVRARGVVRCASIVRPGIAVPTADGKHWYGVAPDICRAVAAAVLGAPNLISFRAYFGVPVAGGTIDDADDIVFLSGRELVGETGQAAGDLELGPVVLHDSLALLVPAASHVTHVKQLGTKSVCVEPGSRSDRALEGYFTHHAIALREHPFEETDEMREAYGDGRCDALAGPLTTLASIRADPEEGHRADRILPEVLADDPIFAATPQDAHWARTVWWVFSVLVDAEDALVKAHGRDSAIAAVPPAAGTELGLAAGWESRALNAGGNYGELFDRDLGAGSRLRLARGANALWRNGGLIVGLRFD